MARKPPKTASIIVGQEGAQLFAPSAARNCDVLAGLVSQVAPRTGRALEIASGTGQHVVAFADVCPSLQWQPTDVTPDRIASIDAYAQASGAKNIAPAQILDAAQSGWSANSDSFQFVFLANLLHLISTSEARTLISESAEVLAIGGTLLIYGPFKRDGQLTSPGDQRFHESLVAEDPDIGYKDVFDVVDWARLCDLVHIKTHEMPANNLALEFRKSGQPGP